MKTIKLTLVLAITLLLNYPYCYNHVPQCKTEHENRTKMKKLPGNGIQKTIKL